MTSSIQNEFSLKELVNTILHAKVGLGVIFATPCLKYVDQKDWVK